MKTNILASILIGILIALTIFCYSCLIVSLVYFAQAIVICDSDTTLISFTITLGAAVLGAIFVGCITLLHERLFD